MDSRARRSGTVALGPPRCGARTRAAHGAGRVNHIRVCDHGPMRKEIRYVELKTGFNDDGPASISWVTFSKTGRTVYYRDRALHRIRGGIGANHRDTETGEQYWISGVKRNGEDRHWAGRGRVIIDEDARDEYERITGRAEG